LHVDQVEMNGMGISGQVHDLPDLDVSGPRVLGGGIKVGSAPGLWPGDESAGFV
jgi:hypothetical protein